MNEARLPIPTRAHPVVYNVTVLALLAGPFYLNDFASMYIDDWRLWLFVDYLGVKLFPLLVVGWLIHRKIVRLADIGIRAQRTPVFVAVFLVVTVLATLVDQNGYRLVASWPSYPPLGHMPPITSPTWDWIDLTLGLLFVGIVEELVFRGYVKAFLGAFTQSRVIIVVISSVVFGLIHWSQGLHAVVVTATIGALFMIAYLKTAALPAIMLAHFAVNFIEFAGAVPRSLFKLI